MAEKTCPECNGEGVVDQGTEDEGAARRATELVLSPMTGKRQMRYGVRIPIWGADGLVFRLAVGTQSWITRLGEEGSAHRRPCPSRPPTGRTDRPFSVHLHPGF
jgi:hypothetical protein